MKKPSTVDYETSLVELFKLKQYDSNAVAEKKSVPLFLSEKYEDCFGKMNH